MKAESNSSNIQLTMCLFLFLFLLIASNVLFAQDSVTIKEINELVRPKFRFNLKDTINCGFFDNHKQNKQCGCYYEEGKDKTKRIIVIAQSNSEELCNNKVFVFKRVKCQLKIIDSSTSFCFDKVCNVEVKNETIILNSLIHDAGYSFVYKFNSAMQKYFLCSIKYFEVDYGKSMDNYVEENKIYDVKKQLLTFKTNHISPKKSSSKKKDINKFLPKNFKKEMSAFIDPNKLNNHSLVYDDLFGTN